MKLTDIEGITDAIADTLKAHDIKDSDSLLEKCGIKKDRNQLAKDAELDATALLNWLNRADLSRVKGISSRYSNLLELAGVDTVPELAQRKPENLHAKIIEVNEQSQLVKKLPTLAQVMSWCEQAKALPKAIFY